MAISSPALYPTSNPRPWPSFSISSSSSSFISPGSKFFRPGNVCNRLVLNRVGNGRRKRFSCSCLFGLGVPEIVVIAGVAALVFGPKQLPEIGRSIGKAVKSFQQAAREFESELKKEPESVDETKPTAVSEGEQGKSTTVPATKESS